MPAFCALLPDSMVWTIPISKAFKTCLLPSFQDFSGNQTGLESLGRAANLLPMLFSLAGLKARGVASWELEIKWREAWTGLGTIARRLGGCEGEVRSLGCFCSWRAGVVVIGSFPRDRTEECGQSKWAEVVLSAKAGLSASVGAGLGRARRFWKSNATCLGRGFLFHAHSLCPLLCAQRSLCWALKIRASSSRPGSQGLERLETGASRLNVQLCVRERHYRKE